MSVLGFLLKIRIPASDAEIYEKHLTQLGYDDIRSLKEDVTISILQSFEMKPGHIKRFMREATNLILPLAEWDVEECLQWLRNLPIQNEVFLKYCQDLFDTELINGQCIINIVAQGEFKLLSSSSFSKDAPELFDCMKKLVAADNKLYPPTYITPSLLKKSNLSEPIKMKSLIIPRPNPIPNENLFVEESLTMSPFGFEFRLDSHPRTSGMESPVGSVASSCNSGMRDSGTMRVITENPVIRCTRNSLVLLQKIGGGGSGTVFSAIHVPSFTLLAVKHISTVGPTGRKEILAELRSLYALSRYDLESEHGSPRSPSAGVMQALSLGPVAGIKGGNGDVVGCGATATASSTSSLLEDEDSGYSAAAFSTHSGDETPLVHPMHVEASTIPSRSTKNSSSSGGGSTDSPKSQVSPSTRLSQTPGSAAAVPLAYSGNLLKRSLHHRPLLNSSSLKHAATAMKIKRPEETLLDDISPRLPPPHNPRLGSVAPLYTLLETPPSSQPRKLPQDHRCPYIVKFYDAYIDPATSAAYVVLEHMPGGSLESAVDRQMVFSPQDLVVIAFSVLKALQTLHGRNIVHRDIKPSNILVDASGCVKLSDFGSTRDLSNTLSTETFTGTLVYMSPERITSQRYTSKGDIWSLGVTMCALNKTVWQCPTGKHGFFVLSEYIQSFKCTPATDCSNRRFNDEQFSDLNDFVQQCLTQDPDKRPTADELLQHRVFHSLLPRPRTEVQRLSCPEAFARTDQPLMDVDQLVKLIINWQLNDGAVTPSVSDSQCSSPASSLSGCYVDRPREVSGGMPLPPQPASKMEFLAKQLNVPVTVLHAKYEKHRQCINEARVKKIPCREPPTRGGTSSSSFTAPPVKSRSSSFSERQQKQLQQNPLLKTTLSPKESTITTKKARSRTMSGTFIADQAAVTPSPRSASDRLHAMPPSALTNGLFVDCSSNSSEFTTAPPTSYTTAESGLTRSNSSGGSFNTNNKIVEVVRQEKMKQRVADEV